MIDTNENLAPKRAKGKNTRKNEGPRPPSAFDLADIVEGTALCEAKDRFAVRFHATTVGEGVHQVFKVVDADNGIVIVSNMRAVADALLVYAHGRPWLGVANDKQAIEAAKVWTAIAPEIEIPPPFRWADEPGLTFARLPWPAGVTGPTPTWDSVMGRMSNAVPFMAWVGSLFVPEATHQNYVWCYGDGGNGKSAIDRFLSRIFGSAYTSEEPPAPGDRFWTSGLIGKRLVVFADCNAKGFPSSGKFKSLCANDAARIEIKGGGIYSLRLGCRFMFFSNELPTLSTERADMRRVIYCELGQPGPEDVRPAFEEDLWDEGGAFITACIETYRRTNPEHGPIATDIEAIQAWAATAQADFDEIFAANFFVVPPKLGADGAPVREADQPYADPQEVSRIVRTWIPGNKPRQLEFYDYMRRVHGKVRRRMRSADGHLGYRYVGMEARVHPLGPEFGTQTCSPLAGGNNG